MVTSGFCPQYLLETGTLTKKFRFFVISIVCHHFQKLKLNNALTVPPICINFSSFLNETVCSVPDLEKLSNPDSIDLPSFLGQNYENRDCTRVLFCCIKAYCNEKRSNVSTVIPSLGLFPGQTKMKINIHQS